MIGLDSNILIQLALPQHSEHRSTAAVIEREALEGEFFIITASVVAEFLHVATDERRFRPPLKMEQALDWLEDFLKNPAVELIELNSAGVLKASQWMRQFSLGRKRILDTQFAAALNAAGVTRLLTSNPGDFSIFNAFELLTP